MELLKSKKFLIGAAGAAVAIAAAVLIFVFANKEDAYRIIKVFEVDGSARVAREEKKEIDPYADMVLISGDRVSLDKGTLTLNADEDKFIYMEEQTELVLHATGDKENSSTKIDLIRGAITNEIQNKLSADSVYEINTPNSTMSVRGTIFYVKVYEEDGIKYTKVSVFDGKVATRLVYKDGTVAEQEVSVGKGSEVTIYEDEKETDYLFSPRPIEFEELPASVLIKLQKLIEEGNDVSITSEEITIILEGKKENEQIIDGEDADKGPEEAEEDKEGEASGEDTAAEDDAAAQEQSAAGDAVDTAGQQEAAADSGGQQGSDRSAGDESTDEKKETTEEKKTDENKNESYTVTFKYNGSTFGTQTVSRGSKATEPSLSPSDEGKWDFDFNTAIEKNTTVEWK